MIKQKRPQTTFDFALTDEKLHEKLLPSNDDTKLYAAYDMKRSQQPPSA